MRSPAQVGIIGCGVISRAYAKNAAAFDTFEIVACADLDESRTRAIATEFALRATTVEELLRSDSIDVVLNLTPPSAHASVTRTALEAGKHVYSEKPLATTVEDAHEAAELAESYGLRLGCAPDIFLSGAYQKARSLLDEGAIGEPLAVSAAMLSGGQETWHPDPDIFFRDGAGPLLDMGPYYVTAIVSLLGPVRRVAGFASTFVRERTIEIGPRRGSGSPPRRRRTSRRCWSSGAARLRCSSRRSSLPGTTRRRCSCTDRRASSPFPIPTHSTGRYRSGVGEAAGSVFRTRLAAPQTRAGWAFTTWSSRSGRGARTGRRRASPHTSSTWRGRSSTRARADRRSSSSPRPSGRMPCRSSSLVVRVPGVVGDEPTRRDDPSGSVLARDRGRNVVP